MKISAHFDRKEFACKCGCGGNTVDTELLAILESLRTHFDKPIIINSGYRCPAHNKAIKGSKHSQHMLGKAADFVVRDTSPNLVASFLEALFSWRLGIGRYDKFTHLDVRDSKARWAK
jgi:uncharacterized protein YcbK (DUF882 family)